MILILAEKPSAARNFSKALGGTSGTYHGEQYKIVASHGHLYEFVDPEEMVPAELKPRYKSWNLAYLPWRPEDLNWKKRKTAGSADTLSNIKSAAAGCDEICIATDDDPTGEGEMLAWEIIDGLKLKASKYTRMYFEDETPSSVQKAFINRKYLGNSLSCMYSDPDFKKADTRSKWDYLSMQWTRLATAAGDGKSVPRQGRLKSAMVRIVGDQLKLIEDYVQVPYYQNRFKDENGIVYISKKEPTYPSKEDVPQKYHSSPVVKDSSDIKHTAPPKPLDLATLSARLAPKGFRSSEGLRVYQQMYVDHIVSYPRTEDKFVSPDQFMELLPFVDRIAAVVGVDPSLLTERSPRSTHVKTGGTHGANRPGTTVPASLAELESKYGKCASAIYDMLARNYLAMLAPDYEYEQQKGHPKDYPLFIGIANIPKSKGWKAIYDDDSKSETSDDDTSESSLGLGKMADPFIYEGVNPKPAWPTMKWLMKQLEKADVGTGATRTSIYSDVTNDKAAYPLLKDTRGKITMADTGTMSYTLLKNTHIGDLKITEQLMSDMRDVGSGKMDETACLAGVAGMVVDDRDTMLKNGSGITKLRDRSPESRWSGEWTGRQVSFKRAWGGHTFTDEECEALCAGEAVTFEVDNSYGKSTVTGRLAEQSFNGQTFIGFQKDTPVDDADHYSGTWKRKNIRFKRVWGGHRFTDEECEDLCAGKTIWIDVDGTSGPRKICGKLADQTYNGTAYVGFQRDESIPPVYPADATRYNGMWNGHLTSFKRVWGGHTFTDEECDALCRGETISFEALSKAGSTYTARGALALQTYKGTAYVGFKLDDSDSGGSGSGSADRYSGTWNGRQVRFKRQWGTHRFTDAECKKLCKGETITFRYKGTSSSFKVTGALAEQEYNGHTYVGFKKSS